MRQEKRYGMKRLIAEFFNKYLSLKTVKRLQRKIDDTVEWSTDNLPVEETKSYY